MPVLVILVCAGSMAEAIAIFPARLSDFRAFYCAGRMVLAHADPYREHPLHECEHALPGPLISDLPAEVTIPAPYPGYVLGIFAQVARLPFNAAVIIWTLASATALVAAIALVARTTSTPALATAIVLGLPAAVVPLPLGQPTLFVLLALALSAAFASANRPRWAAVSALVTLIDPHAGVAVCAGLYAGLPRARWPLIAGAVMLAAGSLLAFGPARELEYLRDVLPLHALVNVPEFSQFSTANILYMAGMAPALALTFGNVWYAGSVLVGVYAGLRLRSTYGPATLVFVPIAFAVFGGSHTHLQQLAFGLPAFLLIASQAIGARRARLVALTFGAAVPWLISGASPPQFIAVAVLGYAFAVVMQVPNLRWWLGAGSVAILAAICAGIVMAHGRYAGFPPLAAGNPLAEVAWGRFVAAGSLPLQAWYVIGKVPTVLAFGWILVLLCRRAFAGGSGAQARGAW